MGYFNEVIEAESQGFRVFCSLFLKLDFKSEPSFVWEGDGPLTREGNTWLGLGRRRDEFGSPLQSIEGIEEAINGTAPEMTMVLSGVDPAVVTASRAPIDEVEDRSAFLYLGWFNFDTGQPLDQLSLLGKWKMQRPSFIGDGPKTRTIKIVAENLFAQRSRAPFALMTNYDHLRRFPDDECMAFIPTMTDRTVTWPQF